MVKDQKPKAEAPDIKVDKATATDEYKRHLLAARVCEFRISEAKQIFEQHNNALKEIFGGVNALEKIFGFDRQTIIEEIKHEEEQKSKKVKVKKADDKAEEAKK